MDLLVSCPLAASLPVPALQDPTKKVAVTYTLPPPLAPITVLETPSLISGLGTTGLRTWEAALALAEYLLLRRPPPSATARLLELGAGTGLVSLVAARLGVAWVLATDGDQGVCEALAENVALNALGHAVRVAKRPWAGPRECPETVDLVVGADVVRPLPSPVLMPLKADGNWGEDVRRRSNTLLGCRVGLAVLPEPGPASRHQCHHQKRGDVCRV